MNGSSAKNIEKFGFYQIVTFTLISMPLILSAGFAISYVFTAGEIKYRYISLLII